MLDIITGFVGSAAGGTLFGTIANTVKTWQEIKDRENQRKHDLEIRKVEREEMKLESDLEIKKTTSEFAAKSNLAKVEGDIAKDIADREVQKVAYKHDSATYSKGITKNLKGFWLGLVSFMLVFVDMIRGLIRPSITIYLIIIESAIAWHLYQLLLKLDQIPLELAGPLLTQVVSSIVFLTATAVTFWFGSRASNMKKM